MVIDLVLVKDFNVFIWIKVDWPANHGFLATCLIMEVSDANRISAAETDIE